MVNARRVRVIILSHSVTRGYWVVTRHGGVCVCALDTELLGHWWYEGVEWLAAVKQFQERIIFAR